MVWIDDDVPTTWPAAVSRPTDTADVAAVARAVMTHACR